MLERESQAVCSMTLCSQSLMGSLCQGGRGGCILSAAGCTVFQAGARGSGVTGELAAAARVGQWGYCPMSDIGRASASFSILVRMSLKRQGCQRVPAKVSRVALLLFKICTPLLPPLLSPLVHCNLVGLIFKVRGVCSGQQGCYCPLSKTYAHFY